jgi:Protein of unknown function (DUF1553)/Protein of unknown function (DUF1549)/Planctomycete cytochrome C/Concanavalin A-like lectin/glucanases superfamily
MYLQRYLIAFVVLASVTGCSTPMPDDVKEAYNQLPKKIDYNIHVKPILTDKCFACHGPDRKKQKAGLRLDIAENAYDELPESPGKYAIEPGNPDGSELYSRIISDNPDFRMPIPASHLKLSAQEKAILIKWIEDGAEYKPHWAFVPPSKPEAPAISNHAWTFYNPIDNFVLDRLNKEGLQPAVSASKELLVRRLFLDLTGLPPTIAQIDSFVNDASPNAYEKQVDKLLVSPHYGEKMATDWLDLARFADSHGYTVDRLRDMSPYRDWVINAFNKNLPYDQFVTQQLAGDLMPNPTTDMLIATAFNRNHAQNTEGGIVEEEFQTEYVVDRTNTFGNAFIGLTVGCAKCHDHKYDPITQKNYYELFGFFNNVREAGQIAFSDAMPTPTLLLPTTEKKKILQFINSNIEEKKKKISSIRDSVERNFTNWLQQKKYKALDNDDIPQAGMQADFSFAHSSLTNAINSKQHGSMKTETGAKGAEAVFVNGFRDKGLLLNGDTWLNLDGIGIFSKSDPFSIGIRVSIPKAMKEGVILHKSQAERLYNFRGYHLYLKNNQLELTMAHTAPSDAITKLSLDSIPRDQWIQLTITYDGSAKAAGLNLFLNGKQMQMKTVIDQLTKDILFEKNNFMTSHTQPPLQIGAWWRGLGFKGGKVDDIVVYSRQLTTYEVEVLAGKKTWKEIISKQPAQFTTEDLNALRSYYFSAVNAIMIGAGQDLRKLRSELSDSTEDIDELMVMQEMPEPKKTHILKRGNYDMPGDEVFPNTPESILAFPDKLPKNRYGLAQWLMDKKNPLTARVAVNRAWQNFFGTGIVKTSEDFGNQGEMPSHPGLLDWLAINFIESGWDMKKLHKLIVMSATYQQSSVTSKTLLEKDPANRLLARGPSGRMTAEMIRDNALKASGLLNEKLGGRSVKPYQPNGLWEINNTSYTRDSGDAVYRRSLYVIIKRSVPNPTLATFDAGSRSYCITRRQSTNTPLQALVVLNDPTFVEAAALLGEQMSKEKDAASGIEMAYRKLTGQHPDKSVMDLLLLQQQKELQKFRSAPGKTKGWLTTGQYKIDKRTDACLAAANAVVASTILNSDACLSKR